MAEGVTHISVSVLGGLASLPITLLATGGNAAFAFGVTAGMFAGTVLSPDLDHHDNVKPLQMMDALTPLVGGPWRLGWRPYRDSIPHRKPLSHWPILGTLVRLVYLGLLLIVFFLIWCIVTFCVIGYPIVPLITMSPKLSEWVCLAALGIFPGLVLSDTLHWILDYPGRTVLILVGLALGWCLIS